VTALSIPQECPAPAREFAMKLFSSVGRVELLHESHLDAATAISSSGIAYLCLFIEALERAALQLGLPKDVAKNLSLDVLQGVAKSASAGAFDAAALRASVTSPNGTTAAALAVLDAGEFSQLIARAAQLAFLAPASGERPRVSCILKSRRLSVVKARTCSWHDLKITARKEPAT
jgi:pyrroline-5-carboxylate reductase